MPKSKHESTDASPTACAAEDITEVRRQEALLKTGALQRAIFNSANFSSIATDATGVIQIFNVGAERMLGYTAAEVMNKITPAAISDPQEVIARAKELSIELGTTITPGFEALVFKASRGIEDIYELTYIRKDGSRFPAESRISSCMREVDTVARIGGDEFVVVLSDLDGSKTESTLQAGLVAEKLRAKLDAPFVLRLKREEEVEAILEHHCTSSIGVVLFLNHEAGTDEIIKQADIAMYQAKESGGNSVRFFNV
jgi:PAS domain-containing protein